MYSYTTIKALIVDDNPLDRILIKETLAGQDDFLFQFIEAENLEDAIGITLADKPDIVLLDLCLPDSTGLDTFNTFNEKFSYIPVVVLSGLNDSEIAIKAVKNGAQEYITKGIFDSSMLARLIINSIERKHILDQNNLLTNILKNLNSKELQENDIFKIFEELKRYSRADAIYLKRSDLINIPLYALENDKFQEIDIDRQITPENIDENTYFGKCNPTSPCICSQYLKDEKIESITYSESESIWSNNLCDINKKYKKNTCFLFDRYKSISFFKLNDYKCYKYTLVIASKEKNHFSEKIINSIEKTISLLQMSIVKSIENKNKMQLEKKLNQASKLNAIGQLAGSIAHDFNNLLTVIIGFTDIARINLLNNDNNPEPFDLIEECAKKAAKMTSHLLTFSRQQEKTENCLVDVNKLVQNIEKILKRLVKESISIKFHYEDNLKKISCDPIQFEQILINLVVNAQDAIENTGSITLKTKNISIDIPYRDTTGNCLLPGQYICLTVSDTGQGISSKVITKIFDPFFTTKEINRGTGMGLSTVYGIISKLKGGVDVNSCLNKGTDFNIYIPVSNTEKIKTLELKKTKTTSKFNTKRILVVEDNPPLRKLLKMWLSGQFLNMLLCEDGLQALEIINNAEAPFDILLTDVVMPEMNGFELADKIKEKNWETKIIFMTGYIDPDCMGNKNLQNEDVHLLRKPFTKKTVLKKMEDIFI